MRPNPRPQEMYRHFKGNIYQIRCLAKHSETGEMMVVYQAMYDTFQIYVRPLAMFMEEVGFGAGFRITGSGGDDFQIAGSGGDDFRIAGSGGAGEGEQ